MKPGEFLGYHAQIPDLALVAEYLGLRLYPVGFSDPAGNLVTMNSTYRPPDSVIARAVTELKKIVNDASKVSWTHDVRSINANLADRMPAEAIESKDLIGLLMRNHVLPDTARWAVFEAIQSSILRYLSGVSIRAAPTHYSETGHRFLCQEKSWEAFIWRRERGAHHQVRGQFKCCKAAGVAEQR